MLTRHGEMDLPSLSLACLCGLVHQLPPLRTESLRSDWLIATILHWRMWAAAPPEGGMVVQRSPWLLRARHGQVAHARPIACVGHRPMAGQAVALEQGALHRQVAEAFRAKHRRMAVQTTLAAGILCMMLVPDTRPVQSDGCMLLPWVGVHGVRKCV